VDRSLREKKTDVIQKPWYRKINVPEEVNTRQATAANKNRPSTTPLNI